MSLRTRIVPLLLVLAVLLPLSAGPSHAAGRPGYPVDRFHAQHSDPAKLRAAWHRWREQAPRRYTTVVQRSCYCPQQPAVVTEVRGGRVVSVHLRGHDRELARHGYEMDRIYRMLRQAYRTADHVRVRFTDAGVPRSIGIDPDEMAADEESFYAVRTRTPAAS